MRWQKPCWRGREFKKGSVRVAERKCEGAKAQSILFIPHSASADKCYWPHYSFLPSSFSPSLHLVARLIELTDCGVKWQEERKEEMQTGNRIARHRGGGGSKCSSLPFVTACLRLSGLEGSVVVWCSILCFPMNVVTCLILLFHLIYRNVMALHCGKKRKQKNLIWMWKKLEVEVKIIFNVQYALCTSS